MDKRVVTIIIFFAVFAVLLIIGATVFVVRDIEVSFATAEEANVITSEEIMAASEIETGRNIFAISETRAVFNIEKAHPAIKVINIERKFPSTIIIHVTARIPILAVQISGGQNYAMLDREMFVVEVVSQAELIARETQFGYSLTRAGYQLDAADVILGEVVDEDASNENVITQNLIVAFEKQNLLNQEFSDFIAEVKVTRESGRSVYDVAMTTRSGLDILFEANSDLKDEVRLSYAWYCAEIARVGSNAESVTTGYIAYISDDDNEDGYFTWYRYSE